MAMNNSLAEVHPELISEWSEKNLPFTPDDITFVSYRKVCTAVGRQAAQSRSAILPLISGMDLRKKAGKISIHRRNCSVVDMLRILWRVSS